jgi:hypothetical protein
VTEAIITAVITGVLALIGTWLSNRKSTALIAYRLEQLENKVEKHNNLVERTYKLEEQASVLETRVDNLEKK